MGVLLTLARARADVRHDLTSLQPLDGEVRVLLTFDYDAAARSACVTGVAINGHEVDAGVFHPKVIAAWETALVEEREDEQAAERELEDA